MKKVLRNEYVHIEYDLEKKEIFGRDLEDDNNEPCFYNKSKRIKKGIEELERVFDEDTRMSEAMNILHEFNIKTHYYCAVD